MAVARAVGKMGVRAVAARARVAAEERAAAARVVEAERAAEGGEADVAAGIR